MIKIGVADYGMFVWYGGYYDYEDRVRSVQALGFDGLERIYPNSPEDALNKAAWLRKNGMSFATCNAQNIELAIKWTSALQGEYVWVEVRGYTFEEYIRQVNELTKVTAKYGIHAVVHNHLGSMVETQEQLEEVLRRCPDVKLLFDTGHLAVAGGDVAYIAEKYADRIAAYHLKGWQTSDTPDAAKWQERGHFCGLAQGDFFIDNEAVVKTALKNGFDGWIFIEHDTHERDPLVDLKESLTVLKSWM